MLSLGSDQAAAEPSLAELPPAGFDVHAAVASVTPESSARLRAEARPVTPEAPGRTIWNVLDGTGNR